MHLQHVTQPTAITTQPMHPHQTTQSAVITTQPINTNPHTQHFHQPPPPTFASLQNFNTYTISSKSSNPYNF